MATKKKPTKSNAARKVLQLMDSKEDATYPWALKKVLREDKRLSKKKLETELKRYI